MKKALRVYEVYFEAGERVLQPAKSKKEAQEILWGNGAIKCVIDVTDICPLPNFYILADVLKESNAFTQDEIDLMLRALERSIDFDYDYKMRIDVRKAL